MFDEDLKIICKRTHFTLVAADVLVIVLKEITNSLMTGAIHGAGGHTISHHLACCGNSRSLTIYLTCFIHDVLWVRIDLEFHFDSAITFANYDFSINANNTTFHANDARLKNNVMAKIKRQRIVHKTLHRKN